MTMPVASTLRVRNLLAGVEGLASSYTTYDQLQELVSMHKRLVKVVARYVSSQPEAGAVLDRLEAEVSSDDD